MPLIKWNETYSVQNTVMDKQHKHLFDLLNKLHDAMTQGKGKEILPVVLEDLIQYTKRHFVAEEALLQQHNYPELVIQRRQHEDLVAQIVGLQKRFADGDFSSSLQTRDFLKNWLIEHIQGSDQKYGIFLNKKGIR
jgi:hemerythrin-like metal-binding protein